MTAAQPSATPATPVTDVPTATLQAATAAGAMLPLEPGSTAVAVPVGAATVGDVTAGAAVPGDHVAVTARFSGAADGVVAVVLSSDALTAIAGGTPDAAACVPALEAAATALGPCVLGEVETVSAPALLEQLLAAGADAGLARLGDAGDPAATVHVALVAHLPAPSAPVPAPRSASASAAAPSAAAATAPRGTQQRGIEMLRGVHMDVTAEIGRTRMTVQELLELAAGSVVELDRPIGSPADLLVNGRLFARGEVVVVDEDFALRITEIVEPDDDVH
ncbi:flagellar motor switch protein FliN [Aquipuribacter sp. SD81]|uniref:flagellar motor switch protein FliN n=1 Tax=Aquipuribacter sp. SD81 TaxID=3127703 RepID=UPI003016365F